MSTPADPYSILNKDPNRGKIVPKKFVKVHRLWPGKAPTWADEELPADEAPQELEKHSFQPAEKSALEERAHFKTEIIVGATSAAAEKDVAEEEREKIRRSVLANADQEDPDAFPEVESVPLPNVGAAVPNQPAKIIVPAPAPQDGSEQDQSEEEEESESEPEVQSKPLLKPIFVSKTSRGTLKDKEKEELEEQAKMEEAKKRRDEMKLETKMMIVKAINDEKNEQQKKGENDQDTAMPTDDDDVNESYEYEQWRIRELKRIKLDKDERETREKEKAEIERRRKLTEAERQEENKRLGTDETERPERTKYQFLQKYYHKGAFFQEKAKENPDHIYNRDYNAPVAEDTWDKSALPEILQKRRGNFGKKGNTKYTHLTSEDTTNFDPHFKVPEKVANKMLRKAAGFKGMGALDRPTRKDRPGAI